MRGDEPSRTSLIENLPIRAMTDCRPSVRWCLSVFAAAVLIVASPLSAQAQRRDAALREQRDRLVDDFHGNVQSLIDELAGKGVTDGLSELKVWLEPVDHEYLIGQPLARQMQPMISDDLPAVQRDWRVRLRKHREDLAKELYALSRRAANQRLPTLSWQLIHEVVWFDPDHTNARHLLGFQQFDDEWVTPFEAQM